MMTRWGSVARLMITMMMIMMIMMMMTMKGGGGLIGYVKSKPLGSRQIISLDVLVFVIIIAFFIKS